MIRQKDILLKEWELTKTNDDEQKSDRKHFRHNCKFKEEVKTIQTQEDFIY